VLDRRVRDHELRCDPTSLPEEGGALRRVQVAVEVTAEDPVEGVVREGEGERIAFDERRGGCLLGRDTQHAAALIEARDSARQVAREETRPAGDVEGGRGGEGGECRTDVGQLVVEPGTVAVGVQATPEIPVVVLGRTPVVVGRSGRLAHES
jgi:hypothetical protein